MLGLAVGAPVRGRAQEPEIERPGPPALDDLEKDSDRDGVPDGWYSARDAVWESRGGVVGPHFVRFESKRRGRPSGISRAFGVDGSKTEAIVIGVWLRLGHVQQGERTGQEPALMIDLLGDQLRQLSRGTMGPWTHSVGSQWTRVAKRIPVPPGTRDAIMSIGLMGARGTLDFDGLTIDLVPRADEAATSTNLVLNGDFELGDPAPAYWIANNDPARIFPGHRSGSALELGRSDSGLPRILTGLAMPVEGFGALTVSAYVQAKGLRGGGGAGAEMFFLDDAGRPIPGTDSPLMTWAGSFDWRRDTAEVRVPPGARRAVIQFEKMDALGRVAIDDVVVSASPTPDAGAWTPFHVSDDTDDWLKVPPSTKIVAGSPLDVSFLVPAPAGRNGFVTAKDGRLAFEKGGRARFHGVSLLAPGAFLEPARADELADRLSRSGINLVRLGDLDSAIGPDRSLFDDTRDDTKAFDPGAMARLDHLIAAMKSRGIHVALELQSRRIYRDDDGVPTAGLLPPGGGPAALFDPTLTKLAMRTARDLLGRKNQETGLAPKDDPAIAWITLLGEVSLFDLQEHPEVALPGEYGAALRALGAKSTSGSGRRFWQSLEAAHYKAMVEALRAEKVRVPIAGCSHWRRDAEFAAGLAAPPLDLVDDRLYWSPSTFVAPEIRSQLWSLDGALDAGARKKRHAGVPYAVGQWCPLSQGVWAFPHEAADQLLAAQTAAHEDWDALVRRGVFIFPIEWGAGPAGTSGGEDIYQLAEVANASPHVYALWPHMASLLLREPGPAAQGEREAAARRKPRPGSVPGWDPARGRLAIDTPFTQGIAGWYGGELTSLAAVDIVEDNPFAVVVATSVGAEPIASAKRLLVTAIARVEPTGFAWTDRFRREAADPGRPPLLQEPVSARVSWRRKGTIRAYALDNDGGRIGEAKVEPLADGAGATLVIDGKTPAFHWELAAD
ncbi:hypothetical protein OJF2_67440 [Aquisphaera giovannonii]|uniref:Glycoside hydrolase family 5 domain-containing protein n=1 Tax=Aquisphaera giovannonii TaxID=406548 RepID=A0A5B9WC10_9BACT|nr:hypothetical protein OJF2_67440 [Aquisphaera giovannonii]